MRKLNENQKITLTIGQLKKLVKEENKTYVTPDGHGTGLVVPRTKPEDLMIPPMCPGCRDGEEHHFHIAEDDRFVQPKHEPDDGIIRCWESDSAIEVLNHEITPDQIKAAKGVLIDNGVDEDEADSVLQAIGYVLLDTELYPEDSIEVSEATGEASDWGYPSDAEVRRWNKSGWEYGGLKPPAAKK